MALPIPKLNKAQLSAPRIPKVTSFADVLSLPFMILFTLINSAISAVTNAMSMTMLSNMVTVMPATVTSRKEKPIIKPVKKGSKMSILKTKTVDRTNHQLLTGAFDLINLSNAHGEVTGFLVKAPSSDFSIIINIDGEQEYHRTWTEMSSLSDDVNGIVASLQDGSYILNMSDIHFSESIKIAVAGKGITFTKLYLVAKYGKLD